MTKEDMAVQLITQLEGFKSVAYLDSKGIATIGIGTTLYPSGTSVKIGDQCVSMNQAQTYLNYHLNRNVYPYVNLLCKDSIVPDEVYAALCSLSYNEGAGVLKENSFILPIHEQNWEELANTFREYNKIRINGILMISEGLVDRRNTEITYFKNCIGAA